MQQVEAKAEQAIAEEKEAEKHEGDVVITGKSTQQVLVKEETYSPSDFHDNDEKVLQTFAESGSSYSFKGLMRKLNIHQQSLSRALRRLEEMGFIEKTPLGYRLGREISPAAARVKPKGIEYAQLLQTYVPANIRPKELLRQLVGKWFGNLRWLGMIDSGAGYTLQWTSEDGSFQINLRLISDYVIIETNASTEKEKVQAMTGSYAIFEQITKAIQASPANSYRPSPYAGANN